MQESEAAREANYRDMIGSSKHYYSVEREAAVLLIRIALSVCLKDWQQGNVEAGTKGRS